MTKLIQTPDGEWIQPSEIDAIIINEEDGPEWSVIIKSRRGKSLTYCLTKPKSLVDAQSLAFTIADHANAEIERHGKETAFTKWKAGRKNEQL